MITFLNILISPSSIPKSDLVLSHNSSCDVPISTSPVPKSHIVMSHNLSCYDSNINFSCPKKSPFSVRKFILTQPNISTSSVPKCHLVLSHNLPCNDPISTSPVPKSPLVSSCYCFGVMCIHIMACITDRDFTYH